MAHFTYDVDKFDKDNLHQGDLIKRTPNVEKILESIHPHYYENKSNKYFIVITQSCDLVKREGVIKSRYVTIAAVKPLKNALERELEQLQYDNLEKKLNFCDISRRTKLFQFAERLFNNNEQEYFYLHREPNFGLNEDHCAFLRLSIALRTDIHYDTLLEAKIIQLKESFQHKLGYLVGNCYSRVGTEDWSPKNATTKIFSEKVNECIKLLDSTLWLDKDIYKNILTGLKSLPEDSHTIEKVEELIKSSKKTKNDRKKEVTEIVATILSQLDIDPKKIDIAKSRLHNLPELSAHLK